MDLPPNKVVYEISKKEVDSFLKGIEKKINDLIEALPMLVSKPVDSSLNKISLAEFGQAISKGKTVINEMKNGTHPSGFKLNCWRKPGTREVLTLKSEIERYFEGFGSE